MGRRGVIITAGSVVGGVLMLWPAHVDELLIGVNCGTPVVAFARDAGAHLDSSTDPVEVALDDDCARASAPRFVTGVIIAGVAIAVGVTVGPGRGEHNLDYARALHQPMPNGSCSCGAGPFPCPTAVVLGANRPPPR